MTAPTQPADAREVLRSLEWQGQNSTFGPYCLMCGRRKRYGKHEADCRLAAALALPPSDEVAELRATNRELHRRMQKAEGKTRRFSTCRYYHFVEERVRVLEEALGPFSSFAADNVDDEGWSGREQNASIHTWFGPSDFRRARAALAPHQQGNGGDGHGG